MCSRCLLRQWSTEEGGAFTQTHMPGRRWILSLMGATREIPLELQHDSHIPCWKLKQKLNKITWTESEAAKQANSQQDSLSFRIDSQSATFS